MYDLNCFTCNAHIGYVYSSAPVHPINCVSCGQKEIEEELRKQEEEG